MRRLVHRRAAVLVSGAVTMAVLLASCSGDDEPSPDPEPSASASTSDDEGAPTLEIGDDGLPVDFPRDEVPVLEGNVVSATGPADDVDGYTVLIYVGDLSRADAVREAVTQLEGAGWSSTTKITEDPPGPQLLKKSGGTVILTNDTQRNETSLTYSVQLGG